MNTSHGANSRPTMRDVAATAGVSPALVSIVFRGVPGASEKTRTRVLEVASQLGYVRDKRASGLRSHKMNSLGVSFYLDQPFQAAIVSEIYGAVTRPYSVIASPVSASYSEEDSVRTLLENRCGALILISSRLPEKYLVKLAKQVPLILVSRSTQLSGVDWVLSDDRGGVALALAHLEELGHREIVYFADMEGAGGLERLKNFELLTQKSPWRNSQVIIAGSTENAGAAAMQKMLDAHKKPRAIFAFNDRCALGIIDVCLRRGIRIPEDISIIGFDDSEIASRPIISLTSVRQDTAALAHAAVTRATHLMSNREEKRQSMGVIIQTSLVKRATTAAPNTTA